MEAVLPDTERGMLEKIRSDKSNDTPRLVYADWLDDHGQSDRAEFIRVQCEEARQSRPGESVWLFSRGLMDAPTDRAEQERQDRVQALMAREAELWANFGRGLAGVDDTGALASFSVMPQCSMLSSDWDAPRLAIVRRGLVDSISGVEASDFLPQAEAVAEACPGLTQVLRLDGARLRGWVRDEYGVWILVLRAGSWERWFREHELERVLKWSPSGDVPLGRLPPNDAIGRLLSAWLRIQVTVRDARWQ